MLALLVGAAALPLATADHAYSHRYVIFGRVVDAENNPVRDLTLNMAANEFFDPEGVCRGATGANLNTDAFGPTVYDPTTNEFGEFIFCFHTHKINRVEPGSAVLRIEDVPEFQPVTVNFNPEFREQYVLLKLAAPHPQAVPDILDGNYTVVGRLWQPAEGREQTVEGIKVLGDTMKRVGVNITVKDASGAVMGMAQTRTNDYGDFAVRVPVQARVTQGSVVVVADGRTFDAPADPAGVTHVQGQFDRDGGGSSQLLLVGGAVAGLAVVIGGGYWGIRKISERREEEAIREASTRRRANK